MENKHFSYKVIRRTNLDGVEDILNIYGVQGWKLVGYSSDAVHETSVIRTYQFILMKEEK